jgi:hypothetical protein
MQFGFWMGFWCSGGSLLGLYILNKIIKRFDRQSPVVFALTTVLCLSSFLVPLFGILDLKRQLGPHGPLDWEELFKLNSIC